MEKYFSISREMGLGKNDFSNLIYDLALFGIMSMGLLYFATTNSQLDSNAQNDRNLAGIEKVFENKATCIK